jgi:signal transduction histidine kinase
MRIALSPIEHKQAGFEKLIHLYARTEHCVLEEIEIDMTHATWFDADMCATFGALLYRLGSDANTIRLINIPKPVERILSKNGFLSNYGRENIPDQWGTTIPYQRFDVNDDRYFAEYIESNLVHRPEMPRMSSGLLKKFRESVMEIFSNAVIHSQTKLGIFSCGQYFPNRHRLNFSIADLGIGIRQNIKENIDLDLPPEKAITWATEAQNTTKRGRIPGGLGLKLMREFIQLNGGRIQIVSDAGYWEQADGDISEERLSRAFPGTIVSIEIDTRDTQSYALAAELSPDDIF